MEYFIRAINIMIVYYLLRRFCMEHMFVSAAKIRYFGLWPELTYSQFQNLGPFRISYRTTTISRKWPKTSARQRQQYGKSGRKNPVDLSRTFSVSCAFSFLNTHSSLSSHIGRLIFSSFFVVRVKFSWYESNMDGNTHPHILRMLSPMSYTPFHILPHLISVVCM